MKATLILAFVLTIQLMFPDSARAHCDTMDGPVVRDAAKALETGNVNLVLLWVQPEDETEIRHAFEQTLAVRNAGPEAKSLAERYFFETVVRVHRAGEGAPYTGLKPEGSEIETGIAAADEALHHGSSSGLMKALHTELVAGITARFEDALSKKNFDANDVTGGREYVRAYVGFIHYVEGVFNMIHASGEHQHEAAEEGHLH